MIGSVGFVLMAVGGGPYILAGRGWWWVHFGWSLMVVVGGEVYFGWWWGVVDGDG